MVGVKVTGSVEVLRGVGTELPGLRVQREEERELKNLQHLEQFKASQLAHEERLEAESREEEETRAELAKHSCDIERTRRRNERERQATERWQRWEASRGATLETVSLHLPVVTREEVEAALRAVAPNISQRFPSRISGMTCAHRFKSVVRAAEQAVREENPFPFAPGREVVPECSRLQMNLWPSSFENAGGPVTEAEDNEVSLAQLQQQMLTAPLLPPQRSCASFSYAGDRRAMHASDSGGSAAAIAPVGSTCTPLPLFSSQRVGIQELQLAIEEVPSATRAQASTLPRSILSFTQA